LSVFLISFIVVMLAVGGMAVGVIARGRPIKGSCGGLNKLEGLEAECPICGRKSDDEREVNGCYRQSE
jgi:hypothetical protein